MKAITLNLILICLTLFSTVIYAAEPVVTKNTIVLQNTNPNACPSSYEGKGGDAVLDTTSGLGQSNAATSAGVRSCTGCAFDPGTKSCTCATCYDYFDN